MPILGKECKFYYSAELLDGSTVTPALATWVEIANIKDLTLSGESGEADVTTRAAVDWRQTLATFKEGGLEFEMMWEPGDAAFEAMLTAWLTNGQIALAAMDGDIAASGSQGLVSNFSVPKFTRNEPLEEGVTASVTVKPASQTEWYKVV